MHTQPLTPALSWELRPRPPVRAAGQAGVPRPGRFPTCDSLGQVRLTRMDALPRAHAGSMGCRSLGTGPGVCLCACLPGFPGLVPSLQGTQSRYKSLTLCSSAPVFRLSLLCLFLVTGLDARPDCHGMNEGVWE